MQLSEEATSGVNDGLVPGKFLAEFLPFLRHVPPWFPGATSQRLWAKWMAAGDKLKNTPFEFVKNQLVCRSNIITQLGGVRVSSSDRIFRQIGKLISRSSPNYYSVGWHSRARFLGMRRKSSKT